MKDNSEPPTRDALNAEYEKIRAARVAKATTSKNPKEQIISEPINIDTFINSLNIRDTSEIKSKIIIVGPEDYQQIKPSQKEQQEQAVREEQRQERKKKKKKKKNGVASSDNTANGTPVQKEESLFDNMDFSDFESTNKKS
jgi:phosphoenolpyruvate-protein kinase (PTS system EI component)